MSKQSGYRDPHQGSWDLVPVEIRGEGVSLSIPFKLSRPRRDIPDLLICSNTLHTAIECARMGNLPVPCVTTAARGFHSRPACGDKRGVASAYDWAMTMSRERQQITLPPSRSIDDATYLLSCIGCALSHDNLGCPWIFWCLLKTDIRFNGLLARAVQQSLEELSRARCCQTPEGRRLRRFPAARSETAIDIPRAHEP